MYFLLSPAKSLNETDDIPINVGNHYSQPALINASQTLMKQLKQLEPIELMELMGISDDLAQLNAKRNQDWQTPFSADNAKPAIYLFDGDVYTGLDAYGLDKQAVMYLNEHVGILSGLYGLLKPLDLILPYRLEMGTRLKNTKGNNLYEFWGSQISELMNQRLSDDNTVINLASNEYVKAIDKKTLNANIITPRFEDHKNGQYKVISFYAKKARGMMVRYAADNQLSNPDELKGFDWDGYSYVKDASDDKTWVFRRNE